MSDLRSLIPFGRTSLAARGDFDPFNGLREQMDQLFDDWGRVWPARPTMLATMGSAFNIPKVDVVETDKGIELTAELPGFKQEDVSLDIDDGVLTIKAEHSEKKEERDEKKQYHLIERSTGSFMRRLTLPFKADAGKAEAILENGLLRVKVPRLERAEGKKRQIPVKAK